METVVWQKTCLEEISSAKSWFREAFPNFIEYLEQRRDVLIDWGPLMKIDIPNQIRWQQYRQWREVLGQVLTICSRGMVSYLLSEFVAMQQGPRWRKIHKEKRQKGLTKFWYPKAWRHVRNLFEQKTQSQRIPFSSYNVWCERNSHRSVDNATIWFLMSFTLISIETPSWCVVVSEEEPTMPMTVESDIVLAWLPILFQFPRDLCARFCLTFWCFDLVSEEFLIGNTSGAVDSVI